MHLIHLIRHARPDSPPVLLGSLDPPLQQAPGPSTLPVQTVFTSPQRRAHQTASALFPDQPLIEMADLREISLGEWDGLTWPEIEHRHPELAARKLADWFAVTSPGGEPAAAIRARAHRALERIRVAPSPTAVVAHIGIHAILWELLTGASPLTFQQNYLEVITYDAVD